jgi:hypothetical protein
MTALLLVTIGLETAAMLAAIWFVVIRSTNFTKNAHPDARRLRMWPRVKLRRRPGSSR